MNSKYELAFPSSVIKIAKTFYANGFELYAVGGAIRDMLYRQLFVSDPLLTDNTTNHGYSDIDFATDATPKEVMNMFSNTIPTGLQHGTVSILFEGAQYEVTSYRIEQSYSNYRSPDTIEFAKTIYEDLSRRDFTINALAVDPLQGTLIDEYNGIGDLRKQVIRCVGNPSLRFTEDALRMLRAIRFAACLGFNIQKESIVAITQTHEKIEFISKERICTEFRKILCATHLINGIALLEQTHLLQHIIPHSSTHLQDHLSYCRPNKKAALNSDTELLRLAICVSFPWENFEVLNIYTSIQQTEYCNAILKKSLRFPNKIVTQVIALVSRQHYIRCTKVTNGSNSQYVHIKVHLTRYKLAYLVSKIGTTQAKLVLEYLQTNILLLKALYIANEQFQQEAHIAYNNVAKQYALLNNHTFTQAVVSKQDLVIDGNTLRKAIGKESGKWLGDLLSTLHRHVLQYPHDNKTNILLKLATTKYGRLLI